MNCVTDRNIDVMATGLDARGTPAGEGSISKIFQQSGEGGPFIKSSDESSVKLLPVAARLLARISCCTAAIVDYRISSFQLYSN